MSADVTIHSIRYRVDLQEALDERAQREGLSRADAIRQAMAEWAGAPERAEMPAVSRAGAALREGNNPAE